MKRRIKVLPLLLCVLLCLSIPAFAEAEDPYVTVRIGERYAMQGETFTVPVEVVIPRGGSLLAVGVTVAYDGDALVLKEAVVNSVKLNTIPFSLPEDSFYGDGYGDNVRQYSIAGTALNPITAATADKTLTLATLTFEVRSVTPDGEYEIMVSPYGGRNNGTNYRGYSYTEDAEGTRVPLNIRAESGKVTVGPIMEAERNDAGFSVRFVQGLASTDRLMAALYADSGQMKEVKVLSSLTETTAVSFKASIADSDTVRLMWVDQNYRPKCAALDWPEQ